MCLFDNSRIVGHIQRTLACVLNTSKGSVPVNCVCVCVCHTEEQARNRFQAELEFIQCLANPNYLNCKERCAL